MSLWITRCLFSLVLRLGISGGLLWSIAFGLFGPRGISGSLRGLASRFTRFGVSCLFAIGEVEGSNMGCMENTQRDLLVLRALNIRGSVRSPPRVVEVSWHTPLPGWLKCNTDGSADGAPGLATAAGLFRTSRGFVKLCFVEHLGSLFAYEAELVAAMTGIEIAVRHGWDRIWLESDSTYVVNLFITRSLEVPWKFKSRWIRTLGMIDHMQFRVSHIFREGNAAADALSKHERNEVWYGSPSFLLPYIGRDLSLIPYFRYCT